VERDAHAMGKRIASALLWFIVGWYAWAFIAEATGLTPLIGPVLGTILAAFVAGDPAHLVWSRQRNSNETASSVGSIHAEA
jgi:hypothetical protein